MIIRIWHGWTTLETADFYENMLKNEIFVGIQNRGIKGFKSIQLLRRQLEDEEEFVTIRRFDNLGAVQELAGLDDEACVVPDKARAVLSRFDQRSQNYELLAERL